MPICRPIGRSHSGRGEISPRIRPNQSMQGKVHPLVYEINTRCWLRRLSARSSHPVTLASVPESEFTRWRDLGFTHVWLLGVWPTGPRSRAAAMADPALRRALAE